MWLGRLGEGNCGVVWGGGESGGSFFPNSTHRIDADHPPKKPRRGSEWIELGGT